MLDLYTIIIQNFINSKYMIIWQFTKPSNSLRFIDRYPTGALLGACACTSLFVHQIVYFVHAWLYPRCLCLMNFTTFHRKENALIREMRLIKSAFFNTGILRTAAKYALNSEYTPNNAPVRYLSINAESLMVL